MKIIRGKWLKSFCVSLFLAVPLQAQRFDSLAGTGVPFPYRTTKPGIEVPLVADIVFQTVDRTPWGTFTQVLKGKFYRARDGKIRNDLPYGHIRIIVPPYTAMFNPETKVAAIGMVLLPFPPVESGLWSGDVDLSKKGVIGGREVVGRPVQHSDSGVTWQVWFDVHWGVTLEDSWKSKDRKSVV